MNQRHILVLGIWLEVKSNMTTTSIPELDVIKILRRSLEAGQSP